MGLSLEIARLNVELFNRGFYENIRAVLDFGAQDLHMHFDDFDRLARTCRLKRYKQTSFARLTTYPADRMSAENFYKLFGVEHYSCVDIGGGATGAGKGNTPEGMRWNAIPIDLNQPVPSWISDQKFDLVTDYGNNEHAFHATEAYRTMHRMCAPNGLMIIFQEQIGTNGYYNFNPSFYEAMAYANNYERIFSAEIHGERFFQLNDSTKNGPKVGITYVFRKCGDNDFRLPQPNTARGKATIASDAFDVMRLASPGNPAYLSTRSSSGTNEIGGRNALKILLGRS